MMDMMCVKVQDHLNSLKFTETISVLDDMKVAENLMKDARNSKRVRRHDSEMMTVFNTQILDTVRRSLKL